ncbi:MAG: class I SAM-dependent methyltransferase [Patescibacteria group bacterium]
MTEYLISKTTADDGYELIDSGEGEKLERYGKFLISRPDPQALWPKNLADVEWQKANAFFSRVSEDAKWSTRGNIPDRWQVDFGGLKMWIKLSAFKHTGLFPEQLSNWEWIRQKVQGPVKVLNLFGYTGGASLAAAQAGAEVCHVDGSKVAIGWARDNAELSGLTGKPIRWILDDATKFVQREIKRGNFYDGIIMDPPSFGHGPKGESWKIEKDFLPFIESCKKILTEKPLFFLINGYAAGYSALSYKNNLLDLEKRFGGMIEVGELTIAENASERLLPAGIFARWSA